VSLYLLTLNFVEQASTKLENIFVDVSACGSPLNIRGRQNGK